MIKYRAGRRVLASQCDFIVYDKRMKANLPIVRSTIAEFWSFTDARKFAKMKNEEVKNV